jgi:zinc D-Ala-D-Ala dipeptidase
MAFPTLRYPPGPVRASAPAALAAVVLLGCAATSPALPAGSSSARAENAAAAAQCPRNVPRGELVDIQTQEPSIRIDVRYATADNFTGAPLPGYEVPRVLLRPRAAESLVRVHRELRQQGLGLKIWDGYRPVRATLAMVAWAERTGNEWVLEQGYVARRSGHNRGNTVDLTLVRLDTGEELPMGTAYDEFSEAAHTANAVGEIRTNRQLLVGAMERAGWQNYTQEWWHFSLPGNYAPLDVPLGCF